MSETTGYSHVIEASFRPIGHRVLVMPLHEATKMNGGFYIPENVQERPTTAVVISLGTQGPFDLEVGDKVLLPKSFAAEITIDDVVHWVLDADEILAVL